MRKCRVAIDPARNQLPQILLAQENARSGALKGFRSRALNEITMLALATLGDPVANPHLAVPHDIVGVGHAVIHAAGFGIQKRARDAVPAITMHEFPHFPCEIVLEADEIPADLLHAFH